MPKANPVIKGEKNLPKRQTKSKYIEIGQTFIVQNLKSIARKE